MVRGPSPPSVVINSTYAADSRVKKPLRRRWRGGAAGPGAMNVRPGPWVALQFTLSAGAVHMSVIAKHVANNGYYIKESVVGIYIKESSDRLPGAGIPLILWP